MKYCTILNWRNRINVIVAITFGLFTSSSFCQPTSSGGQIGGSNLLVPIDIDDPYSYDKNFVANLVADLYGEQFSFNSSMLWIGEHLNEDSSLPRIMALTKQQPVHNAIELGSDKNVTFSELSRHDAIWLGYTTSSDASSVSGIPFTYETEEYGQIVSGWLDNSDGVARLVVGLVLVLNVEVTNPVGERADLYFERFYPIQRFYNEGQAANYAQDIAEDYDIRNEPESSGFDCSTLPAGTERDYCFCLHTIYINYDYDKSICPGEPDIGEAIKVGVAAGAGAAVSGGVVKRIAKKATGLWGTVTLGVGGFLAGSGTMYGTQYAQCMLRAKSRKDADINHASNAKNQADANGTPFTCPSGAH
ncbi:MAG: hypothetical protein P1U42_10540 [Phycisphaerales bacterium]|nr:hypothetical protein [Phycisphaerales bacterium]